MNGNYGRTNRRALDRELDGYMQKSARYNRNKLDEDMDKYMSGTKAYLDKQMDEYMSAKKKVQTPKDQSVFDSFFRTLRFRECNWNNADRPDLFQNCL